METPFVSGTDRQLQILQIIEQRQRLSVAEICEQFSISEATARRDLETLALQGKLQRVHGGALVFQQTPQEPPMLQRQVVLADEKRRIGLAAAGLIHDGETVILGSGTTVLEAARALRNRRLTVITNSLPVINTFAGLDNINLICLGGMLRDSELSFIGHITEQALAEVRADKVIIGTFAISLEHGLTHDYLPETMTDRSILKAGNEVIVVADHSKFGRLATAMLAPLQSAQVIVTDADTPQEVVDEIRGRGIRVILS